VGPVSGSGSQTRCYKQHLMLAEAIKNHIYNSFYDFNDAHETLLGKKMMINYFIESF
jgi:hypothetical protein